jgi:hypothetical protein
MTKEHYICKVCDYATKVKCNYEKHNRTYRHQRKIIEINNMKANKKKSTSHSTPKRYCNICEQGFSQKSNLDRHNIRFHREKVDDNLKSALYNIKLKSKDEIKTYIDEQIELSINKIKNDVNDGKIRCSFCGLVCTKHSNKVRHENICASKKITDFESRIEQYDNYIDDLKQQIITMEEKQKKKNRNGNRITAPLRTKIWNTYIGEDIGKTKCPCCKEINITQLNFDCGHIKSLHDNGSTTVNNIIPLCGVCNKSMGNQHLVQFMDNNNFGDLPFKINNE